MKWTKKRGIERGSGKRSSKALDGGVTPKIQAPVGPTTWAHLTEVQAPSQDSQGYVLKACPKKTKLNNNLHIKLN